MIDIYLGCPYSHFDEAVRRQRFEAVNEFASKLMREGLLVFSPISHTHPIALYELPLGWEFWERYDREFLEISRTLVVLKLPGYLESTGVNAEVRIMQTLCRPICYAVQDYPAYAIKRWFDSVTSMQTVTTTA